MLGIEKEYLEKYASYADSLLYQKYGEDYTAKDVEKLASALIDYDLEKAAEYEKVEFLKQAAEIQARGFADELIKIAGFKFFEKVAISAAAKLLNKFNVKNVDEAAKVLAKHKNIKDSKNVRKIFLEYKPVMKSNKSVASKGVSGAQKEIAASKASKSRHLKNWNKSKGGLKADESFYKKKVYKSTDIKKNGKPRKNAKPVERGERLEELRKGKAGTQLERNRSFSRAEEFRKNDAISQTNKSKGTGTGTKNSNKGEYNFDKFKQDVKSNWTKSKEFAKKNPWAVGAAGVGAAGAGYAANSFINS